MFYMQTFLQACTLLYLKFIKLIHHMRKYIHMPTEGDDEISFDPDDIIENIEMVDDGWWIGECHGKRGLFPSNYVEKM